LPLASDHTAQGQRWVSDGSAMDRKHLGINHEHGIEGDASPGESEQASIAKSKFCYASS